MNEKRMDFKKKLKIIKLIKLYHQIQEAKKNATN